MPKITESRVEVLQGADGTLKIAEARAETLSKNFGDARVAEFSAEVLSENFGKIRLTEHCIEILESLKPVPAMNTLPYTHPQGVFILVELYIGARILRMSNADGVILTHYWDNYIMGIDSPGWQMDYVHGGYVRFSLGSLEVSFEAFSEVGIPPRQSCPCKIKYTWTTEEDAVLIFQGTAHPSEFTNESVKYNLYGIDAPVYVLDSDYVSESVIDAVKTDIYFWHLSGSGTCEYYLTLDSSESPGITRPARVMAGNSEIVSGTTGVLTAGTWGFGDNDSLGFSTLYVRMYNGGSPEIFEDGYIRLEYLDLNQEKTVFPKAFGRTVHQEPAPFTRINGLLTYHKAGIINDLADVGVIQSFESADEGRYTVITSDTAHGMTAGDIAAVESTVNYNGLHKVVSSTTYTATIEFQYIPETLPEGGRGYIYNSEDWCVYEDGVPINNLILENSNGTFSVNGTVNGKITLTGYGQYTDLKDIADSCAVASGLEIDLSGANQQSLPVSVWQTEQKLVFDFLSEITAAFAHFFYIWENTLYLCDMFRENGTGTMTDSDCMASPVYTVPQPYSAIAAIWQENEAGLENGQRAVITREKEVVRPSKTGFGNRFEFNPYSVDRGQIVRNADQILAIIQSLGIRADIPFDGSIPVPFPGARFAFSDEQFENIEYSGYFFVRGISLNFADLKMTLIGEITNATILCNQELLEFPYVEITESLQMNQGLLEFPYVETTEALQMNQELLEFPYAETAESLQMNQIVLEFVYVES